MVFKLAKKEVSRKNRETQPSEFVKCSFTIPFSLLRLLDEESKVRGYTRSEALRQAVRRLLETWTGRRL
jgi:metal-responsive CopG/Arc/MetJ family transcriptional regulator